MGISEEIVMEEINLILQDIAEQSQFENTMIVYEHMLAEEEAHQAQWWSSVGPGFDEDDYNYEEWN